MSISSESKWMNGQVLEFWVAKVCPQLGKNMAMNINNCCTDMSIDDKKWLWGKIMTTIRNSEEDL